MQILLISGDRKLMPRIARYLEGAEELAGELVAAETWQAAATHLSSEPTDSVLLDLSVSGAAGAIAGIQRQEPGLPVVVLVDPEHLGDVEDALAAGAEDYLLKDDIQAELLQRVLRYAVGKAEAKRALNRGNEKRRRVEARLEEKEEQYLQVIENMSDALMLSDREGSITFANTPCLETFGLSPADLMSRRFEDLVAPEWRERLRERHERRIRGEEVPDRFEYEGLRKNGDRIWLEVGVTTITRNGEVVGTQSLHRDITERKHQQEQRRKLEAHLLHAQKLESLGLVAGGIAHDFNNLLMVILGNTRILQEQMKPSSEQAGFLEDAIQAANRASDLCRQMLAYAGKGKFVIETMDLNQLVQEMSGLLQTSVTNRIEIRYDLADDLPSIHADSTELRQVLLNLVTNAAEAIGHVTGRITIRTSARHCDQDFLAETILGGELPEARYVVLEVIDTGSGIDHALHSRIFDPFFSTKFLGRGLGLAAVQGIVRTHRGAMALESTPGKGTRFQVLLPSADSRVQTLETPDITRDTWRGSGTLLFVDDETAVRTVAKHMLEHLGFQVWTAGDGIQALEVYRERESEINGVLLDLTMPRLGGEETLEELHRIRDDLPVIIVSGWSAEKLQSLFADKNVAGILTKPIKLESLRDMLQKVFQ